MLYLVLPFAGAVAAAWILWQRRDPVLLAALFLAGGAVLIADHLAVIWLELYQFRPGFFMKGTSSDSVMGALLTEGVFVPSLVVIYTGLLPGWRAVVAGTATVAAVELIFLRLDLLGHQGWRTWYTVAGFAGFFWLADHFRAAALVRGIAAGWPRAVSRLGMALHLLQIEDAFIMQVKGLVVAGRQWLGPYLANEGLLVAVPQYVTVGPLAFWVINGRRESRWLRLAATSGLLMAFDYLFVWLGWWMIQPPYTPLWHAVSRTAAIGAACLADDMLGRWLERPSRVET